MDTVGCGDTERVRQGECYICLEELCRAPPQWTLPAVPAAGSPRDLVQCTSCRQTFHLYCQLCWNAVLASQGKVARCSLCRAPFLPRPGSPGVARGDGLAMMPGPAVARRGGTQSTSTPPLPHLRVRLTPVPRAAPAAASAASAVQSHPDHVADELVDYEGMDAELERLRGVVRQRMNHVLSETMYRKSPLWQPLRVDKKDRSGTSTVFEGRPVNLKTFHCMTFLDRNFNVVDNERLRWQDGSFGPFYERWLRLITPGRHPNSFEPMMRLATGLDASQELSDPVLRVTKVATGEDITASVHSQLRKLLHLDESIQTYKRCLTHFEPWLAARSARLTAEEATRSRADLDAEEAHRQRFSAVMASATGGL